MNTSPETIARSYRAEPHALFGACLTALGTMQARIERHDIERGLIVARGAGLARAGQRDHPAH